MIATDEDALICDLAETYQIFDYKQMPPSKVAIFAIGLKNDSRIKMKMIGAKVTMETTLLSFIADGINLLLWAKTKDGAKGINRPKAILSGLYEKDSDKISTYASGEDFEKARQKLLKGG